MRRVVLISAILLAAVSGISFWWLAERAGSYPPSAESETLVQRPNVPSVQQAEPVPKAAESNSVSAVIAPAPTEDGWFKAFASDDPYPIMLKLREARQPGSFAKAREVRDTCLEATLALRSPGTRPLEANHPNYAARLKSKEVLFTRCGRITESVALDMTPLADDVDGLSYAKARLAHTSTSILQDRAEFKVTTKELARQGQLAHVAKWLVLTRKWNGESWADAPAELGTALMMAQFKATSEPGMAENDIRLHLKCYRGGVCVKSYDDFLLNVPENQRERVSKTAEEMAAIFRANDYNKLFQAIGIKPD